MRIFLCCDSKVRERGGGWEEESEKRGRGEVGEGERYKNTGYGEREREGDRGGERRRVRREGRGGEC